MPKDFDIARVDESVTDEEIQLATSDHPVTTYTPTDAQNILDDEPRGLTAYAARTPAECLANLARMRANHTSIGGVGLCLYDVRWFGWGVAAMWPTAEAAGLHGRPIHRFKRFADAPRGMSLIFVNDHVWHITVSTGGGFNNTSDLHEPGYNGIATIARTYEWCGAHDWYGIEVVEGVDVWPNPKTPKPKPKPLSLAERIKIVRHDYQRAKANGHEHHAARLKLWLEQMERREAKQ